MTSHSPRHSPSPPAATGRTSLTDRYVYAATHGLPEDQRDDVAAELRASIADRVESMGDEHPGISAAEAEHDTLAELGDPDRMAAGYTGRQLQLIGPGLYPAYIRVLKPVLATAVPTATLVIAVLDVIGGDSFGSVLGNAIWMAIVLTIQITFWVTLVFALIERGKTSDDVRRSLAVEWSPERLPEVPRGSRASLGEMATNIVWLGIMGAAIVWQQVRSPLHDGGERVPVLDPGLWSFWLPLILVLLVAEAIFEVVRYRSGGLPRYALVNLVLGALFTAPIVYLAATQRLFNPAAVTAIQKGWPDFDAGVASTVVLVVALAMWAFDGYDGWRKARTH